ncbi:molybdate ABC transporter permease subunit, partial [Campylobacter jejuni]|nr:molybdate ABC transporter permease subunit [Campylobacter coli]
TLAHQYAFTLFAISFTILLSLYFVNKKIAL